MSNYSAIFLDVIQHSQYECVVDFAPAALLWAFIGDKCRAG